MLAIKNPRNGQRVYVKSYYAGHNKGGGTFVYDATKSSINDDGVIINGWVRQVNNFITPCMFGAYADDSTNDVAYIQKAMDFSVLNKKELHFEGYKYVVSRTTFTSDYMQDLLLIKGGIKMVGNGASIRIDQKNAPNAQKLINLFRPLRPNGYSDSNYSLIIDKIEISGFTFDG